MSDDALHAADAIDGVIRPLVEWTLSRFPEGEDVQLCSRSDLTGRMRHLAEAVGTERPELLVESTRWSRAADPNATDELRMQLEALRETVRAHLPPSVADRAEHAILAALEDLERPLPPVELETVLADLDPLALQYVEAILAHRIQEASDLVTDAVRSGRDVRDVLLHVVAPAQIAMGELWHRGEISIADEHLGTGTTSALIAILGARAPAHAGIAKRRRVLLAAVGGDLHDIGVRLVSSFFALAGWSVTSLGANTPIAEIYTTAEDGGFDAIGISANSLLTLRPIKRLIRMIRAESRLDRTVVLAGGFPFNRIPDLWQSVGADAGARDAADAVALADRWLDCDGST